VLAACGRADGGDVVELRMWAMGREGEVVQELVRDFERDNPDVRVRVQQIPWTAAHEKLLTAYVGESTPDLSQLGNTWISELSAIGALMPLNERIAASSVITPSGYFPGVWATNVVDDVVWGVPWYVDTRLLFYRTDLLARAGYDAPPRTWDAWRKAMEDVKAQAPDRYAIFLPTNEWAQPVILGMQAGSPLLKDGGRYGAFTDSAYERAFEFYISLFRDRLAPPAGNNDIANVYQEFERGLFAMYITGPWTIGEFARRLPADMQDRWATAPLPSPRGDSIGVSMAGGSSLVVFRRSEHPDEAWRLVEYLSRPDVQFRFFQLTGDLPARLESWQDSSLIGNRYAHAFWEQLQHVEPLPKGPEWENIATKLYQSAETVIRGSTRPADALARLDADVDQLLETRRWLMARPQQDDQR
jgi:multiple sugar transport system substrate-binding protein